MAPALPRTGFNSSGLVRLLAALAVADVAGPKQNFADRLGLWLDWTDAIALSTALQARPAAPSPGAKPAAAPPVPTPTPTSGITEEFTRVRADLAKLISTDAVFRADQPGSSVPPPVPGAHAAGGLDFAPYRRSHRAHQRAMEARIGPLRSQVRAALSRRSPALGRLAALDAVLDQALAARERHLLSTVPTLLEARFRRLDKGHQEGSAPARRPGHPDPGLQPARWLAGYCKDMQAVLLAELDLRLQPVEGMIEAMRHEATTSHD